MIYLFVHDDSLTRFTTGTEQLTKCFEPLQKMRVRLGPCKTGLSSPPPSVILYYSPFQCDDSVVVLIVGPSYTHILLEFQWVQIAHPS